MTRARHHGVVMSGQCRFGKVILGDVQAWSVERSHGWGLRVRHVMTAVGQRNLNLIADALKYLPYLSGGLQACDFTPHIGGGMS